MGIVRVSAFGVSADGFGAGPDRSLGHPLGVGGVALLGRGEALFAGLDRPALGYRVRERVVTPRAQHLFLERARL